MTAARKKTRRRKFISPKKICFFLRDQHAACIFCGCAKKRVEGSDILTDRIVEQIIQEMILSTEKKINW